MGITQDTSAPHEQAQGQILRAWQEEARKRLWHLDAALFAPDGMATACAAKTLRLMLILPDAPSASLSLDLGRIPENWNTLPVVWVDVRALVEMLYDRVLGWMRRTDGQEAGPDRMETAFLILFAAISDQRIKQQESRLDQQRQEAALTQHLASRFLVNASHELRTPLTAVLGFAELLLEDTYGEINEEQRVALSNIENSAQNLLEIVNNMLDLLHIRAGKLTLQYRPVNVDGQLRDLYQILMPLSQRKSVTFTYDVPTEIGIIEADENILRHIVYHLLASSLRATPADGTVRLAAERSETILTLIVQDTALHLPPEAIANMSDTYPILENSPARGYEGWEVGLPLVQRYVELHGGTMTLESMPERGTTFRIAIPTKRPKNDA